MGNGKAQYYVIYRRGTDEAVVWGDARTCAGALGMTMNTFYSTLSRIRSGVNRKWEVYQEDLKEAHYENDPL